MVHAISDIHEAVVVHITRCDAAISEITGHLHAPGTLPVTEINHDAMDAGIDIRAAVIPDRNNINESILVHVGKFQLRTSAFPFRARHPAGGLNVDQRLANNGIGFLGDEIACCDNQAEKRENQIIWFHFNFFFKIKKNQSILFSFSLRNISNS